MNLQQLYTDLILEHNQDKRNRHEMKDPTISEHGHNPNCGDDITLHLKIKDGIIEDLSYTGQGCAISQASTSMMIDLLKGRSVEDALATVDLFLGMIKREITDEDRLAELEEAIALKNISNMPARVKCAVLSWHTLQSALQDKDKWQ